MVVTLPFYASLEDYGTCTLVVFCYMAALEAVPDKLVS